MDKHGVHVYPSKIQVILDWLAPLTLTDYFSFLGLTNFYHGFLVKVLSSCLASQTRGIGWIQTKID
jgi:hypothetical protein